MKPNLKIYTFLILILGIIGFLIYINDFYNSILNIDITTISTKDDYLTYRTDESLPIVKRSFDNGNKILYGNINFGNFKESIVKFNSDNCIEYIIVNEIRFNNDTNCNQDKTFEVDLSKVLKNGSNSFKISINISNHALILTSSPSLKDPIFSLFLFTIFIYLLISITYILKFFKLKPIFSFIISAFFLITLFYLYNTGFFERKYDLLESGGHLDYINYVVTKSAIPTGISGWEYHQPPVYYFISSIVTKISQEFSLIGIYTLLRLESIIFYLIFLIFSYLIIKEFIKQKRYSILAASLISFWPSGIIHSIRIGNDSAFYCLYAASLYFIVKFYKDHDQKNIYIASVLACLSILTKANGAILYAIIPFILLFKYLNKKKKKWIYISIKSGLILSIGFILSFFNKISLYLNGEMKDWLLGNVYVNDGLKVGNQLKNYINFDITTFLTHPFASTWDNTLGRQYFLNQLLKTSLFGEFNFDVNIKQSIGIIMSYLLIVIVICVILFLLKYFKKKYLVLLLSLVFSIIFLILYRLKEPYSSNNDFRYVLPILISIIIFYVIFIRELVKSKRLKILGYILYIIGIIFCLLSIVFFLSSYS